MVDVTTGTCTRKPANVKWKEPIFKINTGFQILAIIIIIKSLSRVIPRLGTTKIDTNSCKEIEDQRIGRTRRGLTNWRRTYEEHIANMYFFGMCGQSFHSKIRFWKGHRQTLSKSHYYPLTLSVPYWTQVA